MLHGLPSIRQYLFSLYECRYSVFFQSLGEDHFDGTDISLALTYTYCMPVSVCFTFRQQSSSVLFSNVPHAAVYFLLCHLTNECETVFFFTTATVEQEMKKDWLFAPHYRYYVREMRIQAYSQLLESYRSLTLGYMAEAFGVSTEFIDQ